MAATVYAFLVGINAYPAPLRPLKGCLNDIEQMALFLTESTRLQGSALQLAVLTNAEATRQRVIERFRQHLGQAGQEDVALFYFCGHGSQEPAPPEFWHLEPDRLNETLVCYDSRSQHGYDLADKELALLIAEVAAREPHLVVILDACHAGSGTRAGAQAGSRHAPPAQRPRPLSSYLVQPDALQPLAPVARTIDAASGWSLLPQGKHVLLAACRADEDARECRLGRAIHGIFSYYLLDTLQQAGTLPTYRTLFDRTRLLTSNRSGGQNPQIEPTDLALLEQTFLSGTLAGRRPTYTVGYHRAEGCWMLDAGILHGIPVPAGDETAMLALFPLQSSEQDLCRLSEATGHARVTEVHPHLSTVQVTLLQGEPDQRQVYRAVITDLPLPSTGVHLVGEQAAVRLARAALQQAGPQGGPSLLLREVAREEAHLLLHAGPDGYLITRSTDDCALASALQPCNKATAAHSIERLEHIARTLTIEELHQSGGQVARAIRLDIFVSEAGEQAMVSSSEVTLSYHQAQGTWVVPTFRIRLTNTGRRALYCMLLDLTQTFAVNPGLLGRGVWLNAGEEYWLNEGGPMYASIPDWLWQQGVISFKDTLKLIVSTTECDATRLAQDDLDVSLPRAAARQRPLNTTLDRLMQRVQQRHIGTTPPHASDEYSEWATQERTIVTIRPQESVPLTARPTRLFASCTLGGHPHLRGRARLTTFPLARREAACQVFPSLLRDYPDCAWPLQCCAGLNGEPGLGVLELLEVSHAQTVQADSPLTISLTTPPGQQTQILPVCPDGDLFLPAGYGRRGADGGSEIVLQRLARPCSTRSLANAIHVFLYQVAGAPQPAPARPRLALIQLVADQQQVQALTDLAKLRAGIAAAQRILLYLHGDSLTTRELVLSAPASTHDLLLAFDYDVQTDLAETARALAQLLSDVGLGRNHGKRLHVVAHATGGLVARWLIEREGGHELVQRLVLLGTPNAGAPWSTLHQWATFQLGVALNSPGALPWPRRFLGRLSATIGGARVSREQVQPGSPWLHTLNASPDPHVPYIVLAGRTPDGATDQSYAARVLKALSPESEDLAALTLFVHQLHDGAASRASICSLPAGRQPRPLCCAVNCTHFTYASARDSLRALAEALAPE